MFVKNMEDGKDLFDHESGCFGLALGTTNQHIKDGKVLPQVSTTQCKQDMLAWQKGQISFPGVILWLLHFQ